MPIRAGSPCAPSIRSRLRPVAALHLRPLSLKRRAECVTLDLRIHSYLCLRNRPKSCCLMLVSGQSSILSLPGIWALLDYMWTTNGSDGSATAPGLVGEHLA